MTLEQAMEYINNIPHIGKRDGVNRVRPLLHLLGDPQQHLRFVHVAGTNGKGSTVAMTASVLRQAGLRTGMFISPYVEDYRSASSWTAPGSRRKTWRKRWNGWLPCASSCASRGTL